MREGAAEALGTIGDNRAVEPLTKALSDADSDVREGAAGALGEIGEPAVEPLVKALNDANGDVRRKAAEAPGTIGDGRAVRAAGKGAQRRER